MVPGLALNACLEAVSKILTHFALACSYLMTHNLVPSTLFGSNMHVLEMLADLDVEEQVFCRHWMDTEEPAICLSDMIPSKVTTLTVRMHDKFRATNDILHPANHSERKRFPLLSTLTVFICFPEDSLQHRRQQDPEHYFIDISSEAKADEIIADIREKTWSDLSQVFAGTRTKV